MEAFKLPKETPEEIAIRKNVVQLATKNAIDVPFRVMQLSYNSLEVIEAMAETGNPNSVTDAGVGALCAATAVSGAYLNVLVNASSFQEKETIKELLDQAAEIEIDAKNRCEKIQSLVRKKLKI